jgi:hypothetical protein
MGIFYCKCIAISGAVKGSIVLAIEIDDYVKTCV